MLLPQRALVGGDVLGFFAPDLVLRLCGAGAVGVPLVVEVAGMSLDDPAADAAGLGIPADVVADLELAGHVVRLRPFVAILACATAMRRDTRAGDAGAGESLGLPRPCPAAAARGFPGNHRTYETLASGS